MLIIMSFLSSSLLSAQNTIEQAVVDILGESLDMESPLMEAGVDSLASTELVNKINENLGVSLGPTVLFDYPTIQDLTQHLVQTLKGPETIDHTAAALDTNTSQNISQTITTTVTSSAIRYPSHTNSNGKFTSVLNEQTELCSVTPLERWDRMDFFSLKLLGNITMLWNKLYFLLRPLC